MKILAIIKKELQSYFFSPVAYIVFSAFLLVMGYFFWVFLLSSQIASLTPILSNSAFILLIVSPILTMRLISEEKKNKTIELLLTSPISPTEIIIGKFIASLLLYCLLFLFTLEFPFIIYHYSPEFDWGPVYTGYLGLVLMGSAFISVGLFASTISENQIISAMACFGILLLFWFFGWSKDIFENAFGQILSNLSLFDRFSDFLRGIIDSGNVIFFIVFTFIWLFLATRVLESDRWR
ncbi:MAG: ABC transporter permease subunit [Candidatus Riflebacteria bacterium]|jgi:ABC-2 type transport system permease protein|nr:ABC transporter permease subunit [Candidatus Riflebacteria bacterium]